jgi:hypothetical protein
MTPRWPCPRHISIHCFLYGAICPDRAENIIFSGEVFPEPWSPQTRASPWRNLKRRALDAAQTNTVSIMRPLAADPNLMATAHLDPLGSTWNAGRPPFGNPWPADPRASA